ncbi:MAG: STAS domain-containing protein [Armatimonadetes bacterium]|nr:STAS domain-containing protein [Armatimonadota bacterium]MBM3947307.1 STAS domain-containing protein [SAR202 cluster bacterium]
MAIQNSPDIRVCRWHRAVYARVLGPINLETVPFFQSQLEGVCSEHGITLTLDLGAADYVDSDGIRWLRRLRDGLVGRGVELGLAVRQGSRVERTLRLVEMDLTFRIERYPNDVAPPALLTGS